MVNPLFHSLSASQSLSTLVHTVDDGNAMEKRSYGFRAHILVRLRMGISCLLSGCTVRVLPFLQFMGSGLTIFYDAI